MSTLLTALGPNVLQYVSNCPNILAQFHIRQAAIEFCKRTLVWRKVLPIVLSQQNGLTFTAALVAALGGTLTAPFTGPTRTDYVMTFSDGSTQVVTLSNGSTTVNWTSPVTATANVTYSQVQYPFPVTTDGEISKILKFTLNGIKRRVVTPDMAEDMVFYRFQQQDWDDICWTTDRLNFNVSPPPLDALQQYGLIVALQPTQTATTIPDDIYNNFAEDIATGALARIYGIPKKDWSDEPLARSKRTAFEERIGKAARQAAKGFSRGNRRVLAHPF